MRFPGLVVALLSLGTESSLDRAGFFCYSSLVAQTARLCYSLLLEHGKWMLSVLVYRKCAYNSALQRKYAHS
jgi:hypothetical protein